MLKAGPPRKGQRVEVWDTTTAGFGYRKSKPESADWFIRYRDPSGRQLRLVIGHYPALKLQKARERAEELLAAAKAGEDPARKLAEETTPRVATTAGVIERFITEYVVREHTRPETATLLLRRYLAETDLGTKPIADISRDDLRALLLDMAADSPSMARLLQSTIKKLLSWSVLDDGVVLDANVLQGITVVKPVPSRDRVLKADELRLILLAARNIGGAYGDGIGVLARLCLRRGEVFELTWIRVDLDAQTLTLEAGDTKNRRAITVPLPDRVVEILDRQPRGDLVFPSELTGRVMEGHSKLKARLDRVIAEIRREEAGDADTEGIDGWRLHDFRRTGATIMAEWGIPEGVVDRLLNHAASSTQSVVARAYNRADMLHARREALVRYNAFLDGLLGEGNVVPLELETAS